MALVTYSGKNVLGIHSNKGDVIRLLPGVNEVEDTRLQSIKNHPLFKERIDRGQVQIMAENLGKDGKRPVEDMLKNIPQILDTKLLKKIIESDGRDKVIRAAEQQLENIKNPAKAKEEKSDEHFK